MCKEEFSDNLMFCPECGTFLENHSPNETFDGNTIIDKNEDKQFDITKPGVYKLVNKRTGEVFVSYAQNMKNNIEEQLYQLRIKKFHNKWMREDYIKGDRFNIIILEEFDEYSKYSLKRAARKWIREEDSYNYGYNQTDGTYNPYDPFAYQGKGSRLKYKKD